MENSLLWTRLELFVKGLRQNTVTANKRRKNDSNVEYMFYDVQNQ